MLLSCYKLILIYPNARLLNDNCFWDVELPLTASGYYSPISDFLFLWITNPSHVSWKYWTMIDYRKIKKWPDKILRLGWIALIDKYWLVINDWLADIDWSDQLTC